MILVTGGTGFLGAYIIKELVGQGYRVRAIRRSGKLPGYIDPSIMNQVDWVEGDVLDVISLEDALEGVDQVIHSAAVISFLKKERRMMYQVNTEGTANMVNLSLEKKVKRFIYISSVAALGRSTEGGHVDEEKKWEESKANTHYAKSKHKAELEVWRGVSEGLDAVILNPSTILGYGNWEQGSSAIFRNIHKGVGWYSPGVNGFVDVEDVARATRLILESDISGERYIVNGDNWAFRKLQDTIAGHFGKKKPTKMAGPFLLGMAWRIEKLKSMISGNKPLLTKESVRVAASKTWFQNDKILKALPGFSFTPLEETIQKACEKYPGGR